jgi:purine-binding chemotaxis protein CheW
MTFLLFQVRQHLCGLPLAHVVEIMRPLPVEAIDGAPPGVQGVSVIRGAPLPVLDLGVLLGGDAAPATRFVTVRAGARQVALAVTSVVGPRSLAGEHLRDIPPLLREANAKGVAAIGALDAELLTVLNSGHLVPESVWLAIRLAEGAS